MRVFISSVRKGLEEERDSLPGLLQALGHTPVRFEDFSAQAIPSREACLAALESSDACLFLLGPNYGHVFPETGQSATHDEWVHAQKKGIPRLVYRKNDIWFEPDQHKFVRIVEAYPTGVFRDAFTNSVDLQAKVAQGLRELAAKPSSLEFQRLTQQPVLSWAEENDRASTFSGQGSAIELHVLPMDYLGYTTREMERSTDSLVGRIRGMDFVESAAALSLSRHADHAAVSIKCERRRDWNKPHPGELLEVRLYKSGQVSTRASLPKDQMGSILDRDALPKQVAEMLRFTGALRIIQQQHVVVAMGVSVGDTITIDTFDPYRSRNQAQPLSFGRSLNMLRTEPDESVSLTALESGAEEVGRDLSRALFGRLATRA
ncbi:MAG TPA: DUF4062 domain-containing protein [Streptomyces sp.]|uniref:DUF4062 domain-containing protein n=1 Tax=Streptomyces sp. TaxID=1931 RepID=UPI002B75D98B|nr:DUF4062 domain-containing protein [Streptomyces sp.]HWU10211.1 DUF4062 domain-containing protein [Streptomyces sp.]